MKQNPARWRLAEGRLGRESTIWISTVRYDGRPHLVPIWFIWLDDKIYVCTGSKTQKFTNLRNNQNVTLSLPDTSNVLIIEGEAHVADRQLIDKLAEYFYNKYEWDFRYDESANWSLIEITPFKILAWGDGHDANGIRLL
ncbi:MAG: pyridoxamine 5'-phosphate oxidase family protein [Methylococcales bacterium]|nr:pyridoxamine 5'-phosphate oxidase family protein [Methylococcales bacterium]